eukprot:gene18930-24737_t
MESGICISDILTGINSEFFSPGVEVQDVIDMLDLAGKYVVLHFTRRHKSIDDNSSYSPYHKCAQMLLDQNVIKKEKAQYVSKVISRLKERVVQWDSGWITQRIENWKLYKGITVSKSINIDANTNNTSNNSFFGILNGVATLATNYGSDIMNGDDRRRSWGPSNSNTQTNSSASNSDIVVATKHLRPALSVRLLRAEERVDHVVYIMWVLDVKSGAEWLVRRRFREFHEFRELLLTIRPSISKIDFPPKRIAVGETSLVIMERITLLQKFLRRVSSLVTLNSLHPSTARVQLALQNFLDVSDYWYAIIVLEKRPKVVLKNMIQVYIHSILQMSIMDKVMTSFLENFFEESLDDITRKPDDWNEELGRSILYQVRDYIDNLQNVLYDGLCDDSIDIINKYRKSGNELETIAQWPRIRQMITSNSESTNLSNVSKDIVTGKQKSTLTDNELWSANTSNKKKLFPDEDINDPQIEMKSVINHRQLVESPVDSPLDSPRETKQLTLEDEIQIAFDRLTEDEMRIITRSAIRKQVEIEVYIPAAARITKVLELSFGRLEQQLNHKINFLKNFPQVFFGIPKNQISPSNWDDVVTSLRGLRSKTLPHDRLESLLDISKDIPKLFQKEHPDSDKPLGADEFLPIFIYIVVHSQINDLIALNEELQALCDPDKKLSETGYYLATFEASIQHIIEFDETIITNITKNNINYNDDEVIAKLHSTIFTAKRKSVKIRKRRSVETIHLSNLPIPVINSDNDGADRQSNDNEDNENDYENESDDSDSDDSFENYAMYRSNDNKVDR